MSASLIYFWFLRSLYLGIADAGLAKLILKSIVAYSRSASRSLNWWLGRTTRLSGTHGFWSVKLNVYVIFLDSTIIQFDSLLLVDLLGLGWVSVEILFCLWVGLLFAAWSVNTYSFSLAITLGDEYSFILATFHPSRIWHLAVKLFSLHVTPLRDKLSHMGRHVNRAFQWALRGRLVLLLLEPGLSLGNTLLQN